MERPVQADRDGTAPVPGRLLADSGTARYATTVVDYDSADARALIAELQLEYVARYGGPDGTPVADGEFDAPDGAFVIVTVEGEPAACGALRRWDDGVAEIKRMYVRAAHRRRGLGRAVLAALEQRAHELGYARVVLMSGTAQPEALGLYRSSGYVPAAPYGHYRDAPEARHFGKDL